MSTKVYCKIAVYSHFFKVYEVDETVVKHIKTYSGRMILYSLEKIKGRMYEIPKKIYAATNRSKSEFRFNRNCLDEFLQYLNDQGVKKDKIDIEYIGEFESADVKLDMPRNWKAREKQVPIIDYMVDEGAIKTITLQTGQGKTTISLKASSIIGKRLAVIVLGRYFDKWKSDLIINYNLKPQELITVRGFKALQNLMQLAHEGRLDQNKVILITSTSIRDYIKNYEAELIENPPAWLVPPDHLYELLGVGTRILDEAHQHAHLNFVMDLYTHLPKTIYLSATIDSEVPFEDRMFRLAYPISTRMDGGSYIRYCNVRNISYNFNDIKKIRHKGFQGAYNHVQFEQSIMKQKPILENYLEMIYQAARIEYLEKKVGKQRMLIFAASVDMCLLIRDYIAKKCPDLVVSKYTAEDDYNILLESDITVSTLGSSGTAVDIADLLVCLMTTALSRQSANLQALGRLREMHDYPDQEPFFLYLTCEDIEKHRLYHEKKVKMFDGKALTQKTVFYPNRI